MGHGRPVGRLARALGAGLAVVLLAGPGPPARAGAPVDRQVASPTGTVTFRGIDQTPWVTREGTWVTELAVRGAPDGSRVSTSIHTRLTDRAAYGEAVSGATRGSVLASLPNVDLDEVERTDDGDHRLRLAVSLRQEVSGRTGWVGLTRGLVPGVYPVEVVVRAPDGQEVGRTTLFLTRVPSDGDPGTRSPPLLVAPVLPIAAPPSIGVDGQDHLARSVVDHARTLAAELSFARDLPVTLLPHPETIEALARDPDGREAVAALRRTDGTIQVVDGPYVDLALSGWVDRGMDDELARQRTRGHQVLARHLGRVDSSTWVGRDELTPAAAAELWNMGVRSVIRMGTGLRPGQEPEAPVAVDAGSGRSLAVLDPEPGLRLALTRRGDPVLDRVGLAAELALLAAADDARRGVVLLPPAGWPAATGDLARLAAVLLAPGAPVRAVTVDGLLAAVPTSGRVELRPGAGTGLGTYPEDLARTRATLSSYVSLVGPDSTEIADLDQRLLLSGSAALTAAQRDAYVRSVRGTVERRLAGIEAPPRQTITLTSSDGSLPFTLRSQLDAPVDVLIAFDADRRVDFPDGAQIVRRLAPGTNQIEIPVRVRVPGDSPIDVRVLTPDGGILLAEARYTVRATTISGIGVVLSIGAAAFLMLWWARHWRSSRRSRDSDPSPGAGR